MAKLHVWYPTLNDRSQAAEAKASGTSNPIYKVVQNVGHASLTIDWGQPPSYVSWWPDETHTSFSTPTYVQDVELEGGAPTVTVELKRLNEQSMSNWWDRVRQDGRGFPYKLEYLPKDDKWDLSRNNCSHMVELAMKIGGAEQFALHRKFGAEMVTPIQLHLWAKLIRLAQLRT